MKLLVQLPSVPAIALVPASVVPPHDVGAPQIHPAHKCREQTPTNTRRILDPMAEIRRVRYDVRAKDAAVHV